MPRARSPETIRQGVHNRFSLSPTLFLIMILRIYLKLSPQFFRFCILLDKPLDGLIFCQKLLGMKQTKQAWSKDIYVDQRTGAQSK